MSARTIRIATRSSNLALWQAHWVRDRLQDAHPGLGVELVEMKTRGDRFLSAPLSEIGGKGWFVKELETALLDGSADIAVHSMKDVPVSFPEGLVLAEICERADPTDALVVRAGVDATTLTELPQGAHVGTASLRRSSQVKALRPDITTAPVRGNVETRLSKLDGGEFDAIVLATAGLERLGLADRITSRLAPPEFLPAGGQGAVGIECRGDDEVVRAALAPLGHEGTARCVRAEREVSRRLGGSCSVPLAAHALLDGDRITLEALVTSLDGRELVRASAAGTDPEAVGAACAERLLEAGAGPVLEAAIAATEAAARGDGGAG
ncbi:MAG: hydroxymethylbilane synthase [Pseudomonadales bacterium]|jgi:hydroxymethylbilane synthase|nr:hydroxymethylbilane synthase [Pseudomonadales bacterium]